MTKLSSNKEILIFNLFDITRLVVIIIKEQISHKFMKTWEYKDWEDETYENIDENDFTVAWIHVVNRGNPIYAIIDFFHFIKHFEPATKKRLNQKFLSNYQGEDIREMLKTELKC